MNEMRASMKKGDLDTLVERNDLRKGMQRLGDMWGVAGCGNGRS